METVRSHLKYLDLLLSDNGQAKTHLHKRGFLKPLETPLGTPLVQTSYDQNEVDNITKTATSLHLRSIFTFYSTPANLAVHALNIDCLSASNGVCTKKNTAQFRLLLFDNKVNNNSQT